MSAKYAGNPAAAAPRPWRIGHVSRQAGAVVYGADRSLVAVMNADNAELMVQAVNAAAEFQSPHGGEWPKKPKPPRIETAPDLQAASGDADMRE